ncbi:SDR family oxidoreductase [Pseudaeromonas paramecii]|uniref:SDR family oxidoreductase n=1 Tax=Pseudaeromonas paramecii TaxID=2138166 RepID=A0ABP8Q9I9_9GAMM
MIVVTGASGQLGRLVVEFLLQRLPAEQIVAAVRSPQKVADLAARGVQVRQADYTDPASLRRAFAGASKVLLISGNEVGQRVSQHAAVIDAAKAVGVPWLFYTSLLHADTSPLALAEEHRQTERLIRDSGLEYVLLRNGWYTENYLASVPAALTHQALLGSAGDGRIASAARADYAEAAAIALTQPHASGTVFELAGDEAYTLAEFAAVIGEAAGQPVVYRDLPPAEFAAVLEQAGLPAGFAQLLADSDVGASQDALFDETGDLRRLLGHATTPWRDMVRATVSG